MVTKMLKATQSFKEIRFLEESEYQRLIKKAADWDKLKNEKKVQNAKRDKDVLVQSGEGRSGSGPSVVDEDFKLHTQLVQPDPNIIEADSPLESGDDKLDWDALLSSFQGKQRGHAQNLLNNLKDHNEISIADGKLTLNGNDHNLETLLGKCLFGERKHTTGDEDEFLGFLKSNKLWHKVRSVSHKKGHWMHTGVT